MLVAESCNLVPVVRFMGSSFGLAVLICVTFVTKYVDREQNEIENYKISFEYFFKNTQYPFIFKRI